MTCLGSAQSCLFEVYGGKMHETIMKLRMKPVVIRPLFFEITYLQKKRAQYVLVLFSSSTNFMNGVAEIDWFHELFHTGFSGFVQLSTSVG